MKGKRYWYSVPLLCVCLIAYAAGLTVMVTPLFEEVANMEVQSINSVVLMTQGGLFFYLMRLITRWLRTDAALPTLHASDVNLDGLTAQWSTRRRPVQGRVLSILLPLAIYGIMFGGLLTAITTAPSSEGWVLFGVLLAALGITVGWLWWPVWRAQWVGPASLSIQATSRYVSVFDPRDPSRPVVRVPTESTPITVDRKEGRPTLRIGDWTGPVPAELNDWIVELQRMREHALPLGTAEVPEELQDLIGKSRTRKETQNSSRDSKG